MLAKLHTFSLLGIEAIPVDVEVDVSPGTIPKTILVGLPEAVVGEMSLEGRTRPAKGALSMARSAARQNGLRGIVVPDTKAAEAAAVEELEVIPVSSLAEAAAFFAGHLDIDPTPSRLQELFNTLSHYDDDYADVRGQEMAKRALVIAAAGAHNLLMLGPPGIKILTSQLSGQTRDFARASARFQLTQSKAEHEAMLRTRGFQLLMLSDFTGQSEALVSILDPFWESKGSVTAAEVRVWNAPTVVLARFAKFVWTASETFVARLEASHYGEQALPAGPMQWELRDSQGRDLARGQLDVHMVPAGGVTQLGAITAPLENLREPVEARLTVRFAGAEDCWPLWVCPPADIEPEPAGVLVTRTFDDAAIQALKSGGKVLLLAHGVKNPYAARPGFESVDWSAGWWGNKFFSLGLLCDPRASGISCGPTRAGDFVKQAADVILSPHLGSFQERTA